LPQARQLETVSTIGKGGELAVRHISAAQRHTLSGADLRAALEFVRRISNSREPDEFADETLSGLRELIRCDYASYVETNPVAGRAMAFTEPREAMLAKAPEILARNLDEHPLVQYYAETGELRALKMSDFLTRRRFLRTRLYGELFGPAETDYLLSAVLPMPPGLVVGFSLHRRSRDFSERDRALLDLLQPHLVQAYERSLLWPVTGALGGGADPGSPLLVVLGRDGTVLWTSPGVTPTLERHFGVLDDDGRLPERLGRWVDAGCPGPLVAASDGRRLRVDSIGGRPAALRLTERETAPPIDGLRRLGLSRREAEVLAHVAQGRANAEIARTLSVSPGTVKRHLENVYEKLGVHSRTAAAAVAWAEGDGSARFAKPS
jgi:DNA-binding CsgD family transcriptional regulator